jgi:acetyl esterase/lipase
MNLFSWLLILLVLAWAFEWFYLRGGHRRRFQEPPGEPAQQRFPRPGGPGQAHHKVVKQVTEMTRGLSHNLRKSNISTMREIFDSISDGRDYDSEFKPCDAGGVPGEWVMAPGADPCRRVLYIHGGGFIAGSPKSHRTITSQFSKVSGCAVLAIDYRMMPEHGIRDCVADCRTAYRWILENGPDGPRKLQDLYIGGDSAGGNLTLSLIAWIRDENLRPPEAAVAMSPLTDVTFSGNSLRGNLKTDVMLRPLLRPLIALPAFARSWWVLWTYRVRPCDPMVSPLLGDLSSLPPTLVQASEAEVLLDDARRYAHKAIASGSPVKLQTWSDMVHIWQIFYPELPQAAEAWEETRAFLAEHRSAAD